MNDQNPNKDQRPPWRSTGVAGMPSYDKQSKLNQFSNVKAKVQTGLQSTTGNAGHRADNASYNKQLLANMGNINIATSGLDHEIGKEDNLMVY